MVKYKTWRDRLRQALGALEDKVRETIGAVEGLNPEAKPVRVPVTSPPRPR